MKTIALLRHAKSDWGDSALADINRPLSPRGFEAAPLMGQWIAEQAEWQLALVSPALRARQTFESCEISVPHQIIEALYPTQAGNLLRAIHEVDDQYSNIIIVGHNPGISRAVNTFCKSISDDPKLEELPTCACAILQFRATNWAKLDFGTANLSAFMTPKRLQ